MVLSNIEGLMVLSNIEGLMVLSNIEGLMVPSNIEGDLSFFAMSMSNKTLIIDYPRPFSGGISSCKQM